MIPYHEEWLISLYALQFGPLLEAAVVRQRRRAEIPDPPVPAERAPTRA